MRGFLGLILMISLNASLAGAQEGAVVSPEETKVEEILATESVTAEQTAPALKAVDDRKESEIPLNLDNNKKASGEGSGAARLLFTVTVLGIVGAGAYFFLKKYRVPRAVKNQTQIKILQQHYLGPKKSLAIVRVAGESILIGITDHNISMIKSLSLLDEEIPSESPQNFGKVLTGLDGGTETRSSAARVLDEDEEFAISGIKDIVSKRLKDMRSLR